MKTANYYTIETLPGSDNFLCPGDDAYLIDEKIMELLERSPIGILTNPAFKYLMRSELEGEIDHYGREEIAANVDNSFPMEYNWGGDFHIISDRFLNTIEKAGITEFKAHKLFLTHESTNRQWDYWFLKFTKSLKPSLVTGNELYFLDEDGVFTPYYSQAVKDKLAKLLMPGVKFHKHTLRLS